MFNIFEKTFNSKFFHIRDSSHLYQIIRFQVDRRSCLIQNQNSCFSEASSGQTDQLTLTDAQVFAALGDRVIEATR